MNRTTSLFLAMGLLVAHVMALHHDAFGRFAPAYDEAHVAFRLARNLVREGVASWNPDSPSFDAYPSLLWILVCWIPERLWLPDPATFCQAVGIACALLTSVVVSRFSRDRLAGVIAPLLFVFSGSVASTAASGTEIPMLGLLLSATFLAYERARPKLLALFLVLVTVARPEGGLFALAMLLVEVLRVANDRRIGAERRPMLRPFLAAGAAALVLGLVRFLLNGNWLSPTTAALLDFDPDRIVLGSGYLRDFALKSGSAWLAVFPLVFLIRRELTGMAGRAFVLVMAWFALVVWEGGNSLPFWSAVAPVLPILFVAIQEGMTAAIDTRARGSSALTWTAFATALALSACASKKPGNIGSIGAAELHFAWMTPSERVAEAYPAPLGREGLRAHIARTEALSEIGRFMRSEFDPEYSIVTPWPGAMGYQSRRQVHDMLGRTTLPFGEDRLRPWFGNPKVDIVSILESGPDHVVLSLDTFDKRTRLREQIQGWLSRWDVVGDTPARLSVLLRALRGYELVTIPPKDRGETLVPDGSAPFSLLRRRDIGLDPELEVLVTDRRDFSVLVRHDGYDQLANLEIRVVDSEGSEWFMRPTGQFVAEPGTTARNWILLFSSGGRPIEVAKGTIPEEIDARAITVALLNPGVREGLDIARIGSEVRMPIEGE